ncbi:MAG: hypothetical protein QOD33_47 [Pyrinomonadaceae bacterium]|jgi:hypothetical protein|nr:hypothetical protein [Pyrinomonadaceae bacterium]
MALTGHLSDLSLSELIEFFCNQRKTGQLKVLYSQGPGYFYLQTGSVVDARIGVLRGIDAVYYALTLPNANFEFGAAAESTERTINQPWTQVVLEGLRRLDEGVVPSNAFPPDYQDETGGHSSDPQATSDPENVHVPAFLSLLGSAPVGKRKFVMASAISFAILASVAAIGVPAGWYRHAKTSVVASQPASTVAVTESSAPAEAPVEAAQPVANPDEAALAAKRQHEKDREKEKAKSREDKAAALNSTTPGAPAAAPSAVNETAKPGAKKITVTVTYDESGRVTQASGGDASAIRIARQKRFPAGKAGSATVTIPIN